MSDPPKSASFSTTIVRQFAASREDVFAAWTDPEMVAEWMSGGPANVTVRNVELDPVPGGKMMIEMIGIEPDGAECGGMHLGKYIEVDPPNKLSFTWASDGTDHLETLVTVELFEKDGGTEMKLTHTGLPNQARADEHGQGWDFFGELLSEFLSGVMAAALYASYTNVKERLKKRKAAKQEGKEEQANTAK